MTQLPLRAVFLLVLCSRLAAAQPVRIQPLLGVGHNPTTPPPTSPAAPATNEAFFSDELVLEIALEINAKDWQTLKDNYLSNMYYPADFKWNGQIVRNVGIRSRGTASRSASKPGLRIDFDRYTAGQTFLGLKSVDVKNNVTDTSSMHERISMQLFQRMGIQTPREAPVRVLVNGVYDGLYSLVEAPDKDFLKRTLNQNDGWLYKFDRNVGDASYYFEYAGADPALYVPHPWQPETHESDPQPQPIVDMIRIVAESTDGEFRSSLGRYLDVNVFVKHAAIENYLAEVDGLLGDSGMNNFYVYRLENAMLHVIIPWDKSETLRSGSTFNIVHNIEDVPGPFRNRLMQRIWKFPDLQQLYYDVLTACANSAGEVTADDTRNWMEKEIEREYAQIRDHVIADPTKGYTVDDFNAAVEALRVFARERPDFVRREAIKRRPE